MPTSPLAPEHLASTVATVVAFAPPLAALYARRSLREPAGQVAVCWFAMAVIGAGSFVRYHYPPALAGFPIVLVAYGLLPMLLLPPTLAWIGHGAPRWRWLAVGVWMVCVAGLVAALGTKRAFAAVASPLSGALMCAASGLSLASRVRAAPAAVRAHDWFWVLTGHVLYFTAGLVRMPLQEALVERHWAAVVAVNDGILLLFCVSYLLIARGLLLRAPVEAPARTSTAAPRAPVRRTA
jgi:hypothetical protein